MRLRSKPVVAVLAATLALAGCGLRGADKEAAALLAEALPAEYTGLSTDEADCVAEHWVTEIGRAELAEAGLFGENETLVSDVRDVELDEEGAEEAYAGFEHCTDVRALVSGMVTTLFEADDAQQACVEEQVTEDAVRAWVTSDLQGKVTDNVYVVAGRACMSTAEADARAVESLAGSLGERDGLTRDQAGCVAEQLVDRIGTYELTAAGVLDDQQRLADGVQGAQLNETDATLAADATAACVTMEEMLSRTMVGGGETGAGAEVKACFTAAFDEERFHRYLVLAYMGSQGTGLDEATTAKLADCLAKVLQK